MDVLLVGSSFSAMPMLFDLKRRGLRVSVVGKYEDDPCHAYADSSFYIDYSDPERLMTICREHDFVGIVPSCNDYAYVSAAKVASELKYPGFDDLETTSIIHEKDRFRQFCARNDIPVPKVLGEVSKDEVDLTRYFEGAVLVKPVDSFSGRGVVKVESAVQLENAVARALEHSRSKRAVIEEFVEGSLHSHTAFVAGGKIIWSELVDEFCEVYAYQVDRSIFPSMLSDTVRNNVHESLGKLIKALGLADGLLHTQFICSGDKFWIVECMRRCPGDLYGYHFHISGGMDYTHEYVSAFLGASVSGPKAKKPLGKVERRVLSVNYEEPIFAVTLEAERRRATFVPLKESGMKLAPAPFDKAGILFLESSLNQDSSSPECIGRSEVLHYD